MAAILEFTMATTTGVWLRGYMSKIDHMGHYQNYAKQAAQLPRETVPRAILVEILSTAAKLYQKSHL